jgi:hypothetical protein
MNRWIGVSLIITNPLVNNPYQDLGFIHNYN